MFYRLILNPLPFKPVEKQVIYIENEYNEELNQYIQSNYKKICRHFRSRGYEFCYLPYLTQELFASPSVDYYAPYSIGRKSCRISNDFLLQYMELPENRSKVLPSLVHYSSTFAEDGVCVYRGITLDDTRLLSGGDLSVALRGIEWDIEREVKKKGGGSSISFRVVSDEVHDDCDDCIDDSIIEKFVKAEDIDNHTRKLLQEFEQQVEVLKKRGISAYILEQIINEPPKLSNLVITTDYRILLPAYDKEIQMTPLVKAVYLLFLRHPEGIIFKHLMDYRDELKEIYKKIKGSRWILSQISSINDVTNPMKNSINEKCARIKGAFITEFDERIAQYYIITGERGEPKRITLPQELVKWEQ